jgi:hypothetical protein
VWQAHMLNKQYVYREWTGGRNLLLVRQKWSTFAGVTNALSTEQQITIPVRLVSPGGINKYLYCAESKRFILTNIVFSIEISL